MAAGLRLGGAGRWASAAPCASNSLIGDNPGDAVGSAGVTALSNGNYVVASPNWSSGRWAVTCADGTLGIIGAVDATNSWVG